MMSTVPIAKVPREQIAKDSNLCDYCTAKCCRYFALPIERPKSKRDYDYIRWYLLHGQAAVFLEEEDWYLLVHTDCKHLQDDQRCGTYETRPQICRDYTTKDCEYEDSWTYDHYFETAEQVHEYSEAVLPQGPNRSIRGPRPPALPVLN